MRETSHGIITSLWHIRQSIVSLFVAIALCFWLTPHSPLLFWQFGAVLAGYGPNWSGNLHLGRNQSVLEGAVGIVLPGLVELIASVQSTNPSHPLPPTLLTTRWLVDVHLERVYCFGPRTVFWWTC